MLKRNRTTTPLLSIFKNSLIDLALPSNLSSWYNFGSILGFILGLQILTGLLLGLHYSCEAGLSFDSVSHITRDVNFGFLFRALHANGASFFFVAIYAHIGRGIYYGSYHNSSLWFVGLLLLLILMATAFLGYVLPWGQMSYWGATVITNLFSAIPYVGYTLVYWLWGGFRVDNPTLVRFYTFHFLLPFLLSALSIVHIFYLHLAGSSNPLGLVCDHDKVPFHSYYTYKDVFGFCVFLVSLLFVTFFFPNYLLEVDNFVPANPLVTPVHIVPEWYFLFAYAILRAITSKLGGVIAMFASLLVLGLLPFHHPQAILGLTYYGPIKVFYWWHVTVLLLLSCFGSCPVEVPFSTLSLVATISYFSFYCFLGPLCYFWDGLIH